jgi:hypothetical protein
MMFPKALMPLLLALLVAFSLANAATTGETAVPVVSVDGSDVEGDLLTDAEIEMGQSFDAEDDNVVVSDDDQGDPAGWATAFGSEFVSFANACAPCLVLCVSEIGCISSTRTLTTHAVLTSTQLQELPLVCLRQAFVGVDGVTHAEGCVTAEETGTRSVSQAKLSVRVFIKTALPFQRHTSHLRRTSLSRCLRYLLCRCLHRFYDTPYSPLFRLPSSPSAASASRRRAHAANTTSSRFSSCRHCSRLVSRRRRWRCA